MQVPFLIGERTYLRPLEKEDVQICKKWINDPQIKEFILSVRFPFNEKRETDWLENLYKDQKSLTLALCLKENDLHIGNCGFNRIELLDRWATFGILIGEPDYWNRGFGTEVAQLMIDHGFNDLNLNRIELGVLAGNDRAIASYKKAGFIEEGRERQKYYKKGKYIDHILMGILREEWESKRKDQ
jgi:RimJ/RimL family protein N-acetyltransferase